MDVQVKNNKVPEVKSVLEQKKLKALETIGLLAEGYAKKLCPVGTPESTGIKGYVGGTLRNSLTHKAQTDVVYIGTNVKYGKYVELGTSKMTKRPFLRPAIEGHLNEYRLVVLTTLEGWG